MNTICVVGSLNADRALEVIDLPRPGETVVGRTASWGPGGKGGNQAAAAARLGGEVRMIGRVGDDAEGEWLRSDLADYGIDVTGVRVTEGQRTGAATIALSSAGDNLIIVDAGANWAMTSQDVAGPEVVDAAVLLTQFEIPLEVVEAATSAARGLVVVNPAPYQPLPSSTLCHADVWVPNLPEFAAMCGVDNIALDEVERLLMRAPVAGALVVTLGGDGAVVRTPEARQAVWVRAPATDVVDTTGAGDCLCGALAVALAEGADIVEATRFAVEAASASTTGAGARGSLPTRAQLARSFTRWPGRTR